MQSRDRAKIACLVKSLALFEICPLANCLCKPIAYIIDVSIHSSSLVLGMKWLADRLPLWLSW